MALTKNDLKQITQIVSQQLSEAYQQLFLPHFDYMYGKFDSIDKRFEKIDERFDKIDERFERIEKEMSLLREKLDQHIITTDERFNEVLALIGYYNENKVEKKDFVRLEKRVSRLEMA